MLTAPRGLLLLAVLLLTAANALAWDSPGHPPGWQRSSHELFMDFAIEKAALAYPQFWHLSRPYVVSALERGANTEAHYSQYPHGGNNWGCADPEGWWQDAQADRATSLSKAYEDLGTLCHMIQDMGVPAHACHIPHGFEPGDLIFHPDNFEWMGSYNWRPTYCNSSPRTEFNGTCRGDPVYLSPAEYYRFAQRWTLWDLLNEPAPPGSPWLSAYYAPPLDPTDEDPGNTGSYIGTAEPPTFRADHFHRFWNKPETFEEERRLLSKRQNRTRWVTYWALVSALPALHRPNPPAVTITPAAPLDDDRLVARASNAGYPGAESAMTYEYEWSSSTDGGKNWSAWGPSGSTVGPGLTEPWSLWKARSRGIDDHGNRGSWAESSAVAIVALVDEDGDPVGKTWYVDNHPRPPGWTDEQWQAHLSAANGKGWGTAYHSVPPLTGQTHDGDTVVFGPADYTPGWNGVDHVLLAGVTLRGLGDGKDIKLPGVMTSGRSSKAFGLTFGSLWMASRGTIRDCQGSVRWLPSDGADSRFLMERHKGTANLDMPGGGAADVTVQDCKLERLDVTGQGKGGTLRLFGNAFSDGAALAPYVEEPGALSILVRGNTFAGGQVDVRLAGQSATASPGEVTVRDNVFNRTRLRVEGGPVPAGATIVGNRLSGASATLDALELVMLEPLTVSGNLITGAGGRGLHVEWCGQVGTASKVFDNEIRGCAGGGMEILMARADVHDNLISGNRVTNGPGGGILLNGSLPVRAYSNRLLSNRAVDGAGFYCEAGDDCILRDNTIKGNTATGRGGGVYVRLYSDVSCVGNLIQGNTADSGGGVWVYAGTVARNTILENHAVSGGGVFVLWQDQSMVWLGNVHNNVIARNTADKGGGVCFEGDGPTSYGFGALLPGNTIVRNGATKGGGIFASARNVYPQGLIHEATVRDCIVSDSQSGGGIQAGAGARVTVNYTNAFNNTGGNYVGFADQTGKRGNLSLNPRYANFAGADYHLKSQAGRWSPTSGTWVKDSVTSHCIDAGDPASPYSSEPQPNGGRVNMGAYGNTPEASKSHTVAGAGAPALTVTAAAAESARGSAAITVNLSSAAAVSVTVLNVAGRVVAELPERDLPSGLSTMLWDGRSATGTPVPAGRYLVRVTARAADGEQAQALAALGLVQ